MKSHDKDWTVSCRALASSIVGIKEEYFEAGRERVYCYELYHMLRCNMRSCKFGTNSQLTLHGEPDKRNHPTFLRVFNGRGPNPDFIYHIPKNTRSEGNIAVIEVKYSRRITRHEAEKDIEKLRKFTKNKEIPYQHGILLIFGPDKVRKPIESILLGLINEDDNINIIWHYEVHREPKILFDIE
jgi:hypothetical protein